MSKPFLNKSDAGLTRRIGRDISDYERAMVREREKTDESTRKAEAHKKELERIKKLKNKSAKDDEAEEEEEEDDGGGLDPMQTMKPAKTKKEKDPMLEAVQQQAKVVNVEDSFRRGSHFGAKHLKTPEFGTHPVSARSWDQTSAPVFVSLKPLAALPVEGEARLAGHVPKTDKGFWRRAPGAINKVPEPPPKRTQIRLEPADHRNDAFDPPSDRAWLPNYEEHVSNPVGDSGLMVHTFTSFSRRRKQWPKRDEGRGGVTPSMWAH